MGVVVVVVAAVVVRTSGVQQFPKSYPLRSRLKTTGCDAPLRGSGVEVGTRWKQARMLPATDFCRGG
eukprot:15026538-Alexandrium_andersonii.AAC.1